MKFLIVDPNAAEVKNILSMLSKQDESLARTESADSLDAALKRVEKGDIDAVLLNLNQTDSKGVYTIEKWVRTAPNVPFVALFDRPSLMVLPEAMRKGAKDYLVTGDFDGRLLARSLVFAIERKKLEQEMQVIATMGLEYVRMVSHELRSPLSITREGVSLVLDNVLGKINEKQEQVLKIAKRNIDRLDHIIMNMLDISKLESGKMELRRDAMDLVEAVRLIVKQFTERIREKGLDLKVVAPSETLWVYADRQRIMEVLAHLLGNAVKFTKEGSVTVRLREQGDDALCEIEDTGVGIAPEDRPKIFRKFQQFGWAPGGGEKGMGLGLAIAKGIIDLHNGTIQAESTPGKGSKFWFAIQRYKAGGKRT